MKKFKQLIDGLTRQYPSQALKDYEKFIRNNTHLFSELEGINESDIESFSFYPNHVEVYVSSDYLFSDFINIPVSRFFVQDEQELDLN